MSDNPRDRSIGAQMAIASQLLRRKHYHAIAEAGHKITLEQLAILDMLHCHGDMNMTELARTAWKQNANITRFVDKLESRHLLIRKPVEGDRRASLIGITEEGKQLVAAVIPIIIKVYREAISCLSKEEEDITLRSLKKLISHLEEK